jgi:predicted phage gp36 major capsid-like protein
LIDSTDGFFFRIDEIEKRSDFDEEARREIDDNESDDDDDDMRNAEIDRDDDSMNDLSEVDRRDFFSRKSFINESHLMN